MPDPRIPPPPPEPEFDFNREGILVRINKPSSSRPGFRRPNLLLTEIPPGPIRHFAEPVLHVLYCIRAMLCALPSLDKALADHRAAMKMHFEHQIIVPRTQMVAYKHDEEILVQIQHLEEALAVTKKRCERIITLPSIAYQGVDEEIKRDLGIIEIALKNAKMEREKLYMIVEMLRDMRLMDEQGNTIREPCPEEWRRVVDPATFVKGAKIAELRS